MADHMTAEQVRAELERIARWIRGEIRFSPRKRPATDHDYELNQAATALLKVAARLSGMAAVPEGWVLLPRRLTAENGAKAALWGEVPSVLAHQFVPWPDIKSAHNAVVKLFDGKAPAAPEPPHV
jgi:hypothetical protein